MPVLSSYRNQLIGILCKSIDWFLYEGNTGIQWVKLISIGQTNIPWVKLKLLASLNLINPLSVNPTKWSNTLKQFVSKLPTNCLSLFDPFVGLELKGLMQFEVQ